jgi:hypothetical protein
MFNSTTVEQEDGPQINLAKFLIDRYDGPEPIYVCLKCDFGTPQYTNGRVSVSWDVSSSAKSTSTNGRTDIDLPVEDVLLICEELNTKDIMALAAASPWVKKVTIKDDTIQKREMVCVHSKISYLSEKLGVGIHVLGRTFRSEFELLSYAAFHDHSIRETIRGVRFEHWLPVLISAGY